MMIRAQEILDQYLDAYCKRFLFSGVLRVTHREKIVYQRAIGYADRGKGILLDEHSLFTLYSLSKPFCAIGLLRLVEQGLVELDAHPGKYVPQARGFDSRVTVRHLLHHISGLPDFEQNRDFYEKYAPGHLCDLRRHVELLTAYPQCFAPGTGAWYANVNFVLCALIIEDATGRSYGDYMKTEVLEPLGMKTAVVDREGLCIPNRVQGYELQLDGVIPVAKSYNWLYGAGDLMGTLDDVYCLSRAIHRRTLLKPETWDMVLTPSSLNHMGMGCTITTWHGKHRITHNGGHRGFRTLHVQLPEDDFDIILLSNYGLGNARGAISEAVYAAFYGEPGTEVSGVSMDAGYIQSYTLPADLEGALTVPDRPEIPLSEEEETELLGTYGSRTLKKGEAGYCLVENKKTYLCYPIGNGAFANRYADEIYEVTRGSDGVLRLMGVPKSNT